MQYLDKSILYPQKYYFKLKVPDCLINNYKTGCCLYI